MWRPVQPRRHRPQLTRPRRRYGVHAVVAPRHLAIIGQPLLRAVELRLADDGGHRRHRDPLGRVQRSPSPLWCHWPMGSRAERRRSAGCVRTRLAKTWPRIGGVGQHAAQGRGVPGPVAPGRGDAQPGQALTARRGSSRPRRRTRRTGRAPPPPRPRPAAPRPDRAAVRDRAGSRRAAASRAAGCRRAACAGGRGACARRSGCARTRPPRRGSAAGADRAGRGSSAGRGTPPPPRASAAPRPAAPGARSCAPAGPAR